MSTIVTTADKCGSMQTSLVWDEDVPDTTSSTLTHVRDVSTDRRVPASGPVPCDHAIVGEAPGAEEVIRGMGFVGPSGKLLWPLVKKFVGLTRDQVYVDNLSQSPIDTPDMSPEYFEMCRLALLERLRKVRPKQVLAVGGLAARALLGERYIKMEVNNGMTYRVCYPDCDVTYDVTPCWHPAAALHDGGKDTLAWTYAAVRRWHLPLERRRCEVPPVTVFPGSGRWPSDAVGIDAVGIDTEGTPNDPLCMTVAGHDFRMYVKPDDVPDVFEQIRHLTLVYHNAPWDWEVLEALAVEEPWNTSFIDTMERAYLMQTEPQGLKDLAARHLGLIMPTWSELVMPYSDARITKHAEDLVKAHTTRVGRKDVVDDEYKPIKRALSNPSLLRKRLPAFPAPSLLDVPMDVRVDYATKDAWATYMLKDML